MSEYVLLCHKVKPGVDYTGCLVSEKLDGQRAWWDGGISRGKLKSTIPWANCQKDGRYATAQKATGLWSRLGNVIHAPDWWLDQLPPIMLDGELWSGYEHRQHLMTAIKGNSPSFKVGDNPVSYYVYDSPPASIMLSQRECSVGGGRKMVIPHSVHWAGCIVSTYPSDVLGVRLKTAEIQLKGCAIAKLHKQETYLKHTIDKMLTNVLDAGGEGLIVAEPYGKYVTQRSRSKLKLKPFEDADGTIVGWTAGAETDKGSRLLGKMGSLRIKTDTGVIFDLSGFTDEERTLIDPAWATMNPGKLAEVPSSGPVHFNHGQRITYKYRGLTADGLPMEARYWRARTDE